MQAGREKVKNTLHCSEKARQYGSGTALSSSINRAPSYRTCRRDFPRILLKPFKVR